MESVLAIFLKKIVELVGDKVFTSLTNRDKTHRKELLALFSALSELDPLIEIVIVRLTAETDDLVDRGSRGRLGDALRDIEQVLDRIQALLRVLAPQFAIMAKDASDSLERFLIADIPLVAALLETPSGEGSRDEERARLAGARVEAAKAREAVRTFVTNAYDWHSLHGA